MRQYRAQSGFGRNPGTNAHGFARVCFSTLPFEPSANRSPKQSLAIVTLTLEVPEPSQCTQAWQKAILAPFGDNETRQSLEAHTKWAFRDVKTSSTFARSGNGIFRGAPSKEAAVIHPFRLNKFELAAEVRSDEGKH
jgi:hypothetical protein